MNNTSMNYQGSELVLFAHAKNWKGYFASIIKKYLGENVLEVGAGLGETTSVLFSNSNKIWVCQEPDNLMIEHLVSCVKERKLSENCTVEKGTILDIYKSNKYYRFDTIIYIDVLEHIQDDREELDIAFKLLNPGLGSPYGSIVTTV